MAKAPSHYRVTVSGARPFPIDMLRYDRATPHSEVDSGYIRASFSPPSGRDRTVDLEMPRPPCRERWESFGWKVAHCIEEA